MKNARRKVKKASPRLRLICNRTALKKDSAHTATLQAVRAEELSPLQQEALIFKYRIKARKLGRSILRRWHSRMDLDEVDSLVDLSLCEAVRRFSPSKGASFMTFLFYHLKGNLVRAVTAAAASTNLPLSILEGVSAGGAKAGLDVGYGLTSLNSAEAAEAVTSQDIPQPDEVLWQKQINDCSALACEKLDAVEREIIKRLFVHEQQIIDIAAALGYSRCHISRIKRRALSTLYDELRVVMNRDDHSAIQHSADDLEDLQERISNRREIHRRRPRGNSRREKVQVPSKAA